MENKKKRLGIVVVMLVLVLAIGATAGTTLAKYISSATITSQTATVAKWGYSITGDTSNLFGTSYGDPDEGTQLAAIATEDTVAVNAFTTDSNIVAPGTTGSAKMLSISGYAEVNAKLTIKVSDFAPIYLASDLAKTGAYYPLRWKVGTSDEDEFEQIKTARELAVLIADHITYSDSIALPEGASDLTAEAVGETVVIYIPAGTNLGVAGISVDISWMWKFEVDAATNQKDTLLGYISAGAGWADVANITEVLALAPTADAYSAYSTCSVTKVSIGLSATIEQIQAMPTV